MTLDDFLRLDDAARAAGSHHFYIGWADAAWEAVPLLRAERDALRSMLAEVYEFADRLPKRFAGKLAALLKETP